MTAPAPETRTNMLRECWMTAPAPETRTNMLRECWMTAPATGTRTYMLMEGGADPALETRACASTSI